ncbi:MAG: hypothetical protein MZV70_69610 [Desulfobacterales bacterium]|nr:hypothetical protein [Desulfobacterales bacterium]
MAPGAPGLAEIPNPHGGFQGQYGLLLREVHGQVEEPGELVLRHPGSGHLRQDEVPKGFETGARRRGVPCLGMEEVLRASVLHIEGEGAVLPYHGVHGPLSGDQVAPAGGPARHRHRREPRPRQAPEGGIGFFRKSPVLGDRVVYIEQDEPHLPGTVRIQVPDIPGLPPLVVH